ncbi:hypothetical protein Goklo_006371 [Gossypium klotzschianum]|uniref:Uncharacterized protein n=1 Tax=Gossypium klotzschianum TaxID=34286 RepID=A0A7J8VID9_9ROSI|nr:hypothetical protein [Gossypium klotzschianum]
MGNIKTVLSNSIAAMFFTAFVVAGTMWYGSATTPILVLLGTLSLEINIGVNFLYIVCLLFLKHFQLFW